MWIFLYFLKTFFFSVHCKWLMIVKMGSTFSLTDRSHILKVSWKNLPHLFTEHLKHLILHEVTQHWCESTGCTLQKLQLHFKWTAFRFEMSTLYFFSHSCDFDAVPPNKWRLYTACKGRGYFCCQTTKLFL